MSSKLKEQVKIQDMSGKDYNIPEEGSLGLLALGYIGLELWREKRSKTNIPNEE